MMKVHTYVLFVVALICLPYVTPIQPQIKTHIQVPKGPGFALSGAGGRLAQHLALMEALVKGLTPDGKKIRPAYLSGASAGAISAVALSAIIQTEEQKLENGFTWDMYKKLLFAINSSSIYDTSWTGLAKIFTYNVYQGYLLDNTPFRLLLESYLKLMNYKKLGDLYIPTAISLVNQSSGLDTRLWSNDPQYADLDLIEVIMATTALPMAFSPRTVTGLGNTIWIDGGTGIDTIPVFPLLVNPSVTDVYVLCYGSAMKSGGGTVPSYLDHIAILKNGLAVIDDMRVDLFAGAIDIAAESSTPSFAYIPDLDVTFSSLDFDHEKDQYDAVHAWAIKNNPTPLNGQTKHMYQQQHKQFSIRKFH